MVWWVYLLIMVGFQIASGLLSQPKNAKAESKPNLPETDTTKPIPVVFGEALIEGPMLMDYFDFKAEPIKRRNPSTLFITTMIIGYRYYLGMVFGVCWGHVPQANEGCTLHALMIDNRPAWSAQNSFLLESGTNAFNQIDPGNFYKPSFFGEPDREGGVGAKFTFHNGSDMSGIGVPLLPNQHWQTRRGMKMPHYKDLCYVVWHGPYDNIFLPELAAILGSKKSGYIGNSVNLWPLAFRVSRQPLYSVNGVSGRLSENSPEEVGRHANPISCLRECLINTYYGMSLPDSQLQLVGDHSFATAATKCWNEALAFSYLWTDTSKVEDMIAEILRYVDGALWTDVRTGKICIGLVRDDYNPASLPELTNADVISIKRFTKGSWQDTKNEVRISFVDHDKPDFGTSTAYWYSNANKFIQGVTEAAEITFNGCPSMKVANKLAAREGRALSTPRAELTIEVDRRCWDWHPTKPFKWTWPEQGVNGLIMRVTHIDLGTVADGVITIQAVQDVFAAGAQTLGEISPTVWTDPMAGDAQNVTAPEVGELPYWYQRDDVPRVFGMGGRPATNHLSYTGSFNGEREAHESEFTATGTLAAALPQLDNGEYDTTGFTVASVTDAELIVAGSASSIATEGASLALIGDPSGNHEWIAFEAVTNNGDGTVTLDNIWRGLLDTPPRAHLAGARVYFFSTGASVFTKPLAEGESVQFKALSRTLYNQLNTYQATGVSMTTQRRAFRPLPPYYVRLGGYYTNLRQDSGDVVLTWREHSRLTALQVLRQSAATETAEAGTTYEVEVYATDGTLLRTATGLTSPEYTYTNANELSDTGASELQARLLFKLYSKRDGYRSLYAWERYVYRLDPASFEGLVTVNGAVVTVDGGLVTVT